MASLPLITYADVVQQLLDYLGDNPSASGQRDSRRAVAAAYRDLPSAHHWSYYYQRGRVTTVEPYDTGTIEFDFTGGAFERVITLTGGTWPSWAMFGAILIDNISYPIAERKSDTELTLLIETNPGADIAADTSYTLLRDTYPMPCDFISADLLTDMNLFGSMDYVPPGEWFQMHAGFQTPSQPIRYSFFADPNYVGAMAVGFWPPSDAVYNFDFIMQRRPRALRMHEEKAGTVATTADSRTVTGTNTTFVSKHVGAVIRFSADNIDYPTGLDGANPADFERTIMSITSTTELVIDAVAPRTYAKVKYTISDPIDVETGTMMTAFLRLCERELANSRRMSNAAETDRRYQMALAMAQESDSRSFATRFKANYDWQQFDNSMGADVG